MATLQIIIKQITFRNITDITGLQKRYLQFPKSFKKPIFNKEEQAALEETKESVELKHSLILPAKGNETSSEFFNAFIDKFTKYLMRDGRKVLARSMVDETLETIKRIQVKKYNKCQDEEERNSIELDPKVVLIKAVENASPVMLLQDIKRGGINYKVPVPIKPHTSRFTGVKWLLEAGKEKNRVIRFPQKLAEVLLDAFENQGRVVNKKKDLYRQCEANRAYAHYRWK